MFRGFLPSFRQFKCHQAAQPMACYTTAPMNFSIWSLRTIKFNTMIYNHVSAVFILLSYTQCCQCLYLYYNTGKSMVCCRHEVLNDAKTDSTVSWVIMLWSLIGEYQQVTATHCWQQTHKGHCRLQTVVYLSTPHWKLSAKMNTS
jgi:hypothetical protein